MRADLVAFAFIAFGLVLIIQAIFWTNPIMGFIAGGAALMAFGCYIWATGPAPVKKERDGQE